VKGDPLTSFLQDLVHFYVGLTWSVACQNRVKEHDVGAMRAA
jgi:hypothetical protein